MMIRKTLLSCLLGGVMLFADAVTDAAKKKVADGKFDEAISRPRRCLQEESEVR
jgi:hypothetical protein